jgi:hypothetical protein
MEARSSGGPPPRTVSSASGAKIAVVPARIDPVDETTVSEKVRRQFETAEEHGAPNSMLLRILARDENSLTAFYDAWNAVFYEGAHLDHGLKEIVRVRMARLRNCSY